MQVVFFQYAMAYFLWSDWHARLFQKLRSILDEDAGAMLRSMAAESGQGHALPDFLIALRAAHVAILYSSTSQNRPFNCMYGFPLATNDLIVCDVFQLLLRPIISESQDIRTFW